MLLAQLTEMYTLCFRFGKLKSIACWPILNLIQIFVAIDVNRTKLFERQQIQKSSTYNEQSLRLPKHFTISLILILKSVVDRTPP